MTRITNNQELIMLVRQQLSRVARSKTQRATKVADGKHTAKSTDISRTQKLLQTGDFSTDEIERALVQGILADEFGDGFMNDANFQQIIDRIMSIFHDDPEVSQILKESINKISTDS